MGSRLRFVVVGAALLAAAPAVAGGPAGTAVATPPPAPAPAPAELVLGAEDNRLVAYDPASGRSAVALGSSADDPVDGLDINAQICEDPRNPGWFIAGEDTGQDTGVPGSDPGWGYLHLTGATLDDLHVEMAGNLVPTYVTAADNPENYGCGFLPDGRLVTSDVGDQQPFTPPTGQLIVWFPDGQGPRGFDDTDGTPGLDYCKVDIAIPTAGGILVDGDTVYVTANRPGLPGSLDLGGVYRYTGLPTSPAQCTATDPTGAPMVPPGLVTKSLFIPAEPVGAMTPSAVVRSPAGGFFVSSVISGVIAEYDEDGRFLRRVLDPPVVDPLPPFPHGTPYGLAVDAEGSLWYADIGVVVDPEGGIGPGDHNGSVRRIRFVDGRPLTPEVVRDGLMYPDGMGVVHLRSHSAPAPVTDGVATSQWSCGNWGMYGATLGRTFSTTCPTAIDPVTARTLVPAWTVRMPRTVTASPAVVGGTVYVGDWSGTMYALRATDGAEVWSYRTAAAPGASFGPIVSSAAVTDVRIGATTRRLVIFGSGPRVYALDGATGDPVWVLDRSFGLPATPTEFESSPVVHAGVVYIGVDTHNNGVAATGGQRGGLLAIDAATGALRWEFNPELLQPGVGCGSVWSSPMVDVERGHVVVATGNCRAEPSEFTWNEHTEAITALDLDGNVVWSFRPHEPNRLDIDFGATPNLISLPDGSELIGAGNKDAAYYAVHPDTGELVWSTQVAIPGNVQEDFAVGGFIGSTATWGGDVFGATALGGPPWYHALDGASGASMWSGVAGPSYAASAVVNGVVLAGDLTGVFKAFDAATGVPLFAFPLLGPISSGPAVAGDLVVVGSGTSSSDLCAKDAPGSEACFAAFDLTLGSLGAVTAFRPLSPGGLPPVVRL